MSRPLLASVATGFCLFSLMGCNSQTPPPENSLNTPPAAAPIDPAATALDTREQELAQREEELKLKEREDDLARREAQLADQQRAAAAPKTTPAPSRSTASTEPPRDRYADRQERQRTRMARATAPMTVPTGTELTVQLTTALSSKTAQSGDTFDGRLFSDVMVGNKVAIPAGSRVTGTVTDVISGSAKIGGIPTLGLRFDSVQLPDGQKVAINGELVQQGKSDTGRDTAKILGGAAAGAVLGHQVKKDDKGKVIGGILGGAIGAIAAKKTGTEVELPSDSTLTLALGAPIEVPAK